MTRYNIFVDKLGNVRKGLGYLKWERDHINKGKIFKCICNDNDSLITFSQKHISYVINVKEIPHSDYYTRLVLKGTTDMILVYGINKQPEVSKIEQNLELFY